MTVRMIAIICFLVFLVVLGLLMFFLRHRFTFKSIFGVFPKDATQAIVDKEINELQVALWRHEEGLMHPPTEMDRDLGGMAQNHLEQAIKLALKYGFKVPPTVSLFSP